MKINLKEQWTKYFQDIPETGMGYHKVDVFLKDETIIRGAIVHNGEVLEIPTEVSGLTGNEISLLKITNK